ncbi:MAG: TfoX/Sxy family protein [Gammaproteobacteria bacterium]|jgi:DNA transformation protein|nr:TfoX/Sxy family protein [Gammaproteobacteria bacterium]MDH3887186.1 TfoX/Sxy family protein [Gammaproteobacteria bacterium]MDH3986410.1 TfoX/Sxy family protein [Gammaproteobacteria bacterium]
MSEFVDNLQEVFVLFGPVQARRMFGAYGIFHDGLMFALVADEVLYLKADGRSSTEFEQRGLGQFEYEKKSSKIKMCYYMAPEEIYDDPEEAKLWANFAFDAALRSRKPVK